MHCVKHDEQDQRYVVRPVRQLHRHVLGSSCFLFSAYYLLLCTLYLPFPVFLQILLPPCTVYSLQPHAAMILVVAILCRLNV